MSSDRLVDEGPDDPVETAAAGTIVVGHDRSEGANAALQVALELASDLQAPLTVVRAWSIMTAPQPPGWTFGYVPPHDEIADAVRAELEADTRSQVRRFPRVQVTYRAHQAGPVRSLIEASEGARMLVVGSRGLGGFRGLVLGSVSDQCVRYARCPVLVTRNQRAD